MKLAKHDLLAALRLRYDHYSAQSIFEAALERAGLPVQDEYQGPQITAFRAALAKVGDRLANVDARLDSLLEAAPAQASAPAPAAPAPAAPAPAAPAPAAPAPAASATPADKPADKPARSDRADRADRAERADKTDKPAGKLVETTIALAGVDVKDGEQILVCGGFSALGDWNPENAPTMKREGDTYLATIKVPADSEPVLFKFLRRAADGTVTWESGDDRKLVAKPRIEATWR